MKDILRYVLKGRHQVNYLMSMDALKHYGKYKFRLISNIDIVYASSAGIRVEFRVKLGQIK